MKKQLIILLLIGTPLMAKTIKDVSKADSAYPAIKTSVDKGFLSLYDGNTFKPNQPLSRKDIAITLGALLEEIKKQQFSLSSSEINDLTHLSKSFRTDFVNIQKDLHFLSVTSTKLSDEQKNLQHDLSEINDQLKAEITTLKKQRNYLWAGVGASALLSILSK